MRECPFCHKDLPDDSIFCVYCGKSLEESNHNQKSDQTIENKISLKKKPHLNNWGKLGISLFLGALIIFDFIIASLVAILKIDVKFVFVISLIIYVCAIICGILSLYTDYKDKKSGYEPTGNSGIALVSIFISLYVLLTNLMNVILK